MHRTGLISALIAIVAGCQSGNESAAAVTAEVESNATITRQCGSDGFLDTQLFGGIEVMLHWTANELECQGMPRPDGDGARLRFAGTSGDGRQIAFIIALPDLRRGATGTELPSKVTVIEEGQGRFFSTADAVLCWTDVIGLEHVAGSDAVFSISGYLYCVAPLAEVNGDSDVLIRDLRFRGLLDWNAS